MKPLCQGALDVEGKLELATLLVAVKSMLVRTEGSAGALELRSLPGCPHR